MISLVSTTRVVEVDSLGDSTVVFVSCDSMRVDADENNFFFRGRGCLSGGAFRFLGEGTDQANRAGTLPHTTLARP